MKYALSLLAVLVSAMTLGASAVQAAGAPEVKATWVETVKETSANLQAEVDPKGSVTTYRFEYVTAAAFGASGFANSIKAPLGGEADAGGNEGPLKVPAQHIGGLQPATSYRYRVIAKSTEGSTIGPTRYLETDESTPTFSLPDGRGWEMVSPVEKNNGGIAAPESLFGGGVPQAAAQGSALTYDSSSSFASAEGASGTSQYLSRRDADGWSTENLTVPLISGSYPRESDSGVPYQLFSGDLTSALLSNGRRCRGEATACPVANPPLPGSGAPEGYRNYYLLSSTGAFSALLGAADVASQQADDFEVTLAGASPDLSQVVLSSCSGLTADATEVLGPGTECDPAKQNLYRRSASGLILVNVLPGDAQGTPGAALAPGPGALGPSRAFFTVTGNLYLREGAQTLQVDESLGGGGAFEAASSDGSVAFFTKAGHLYRYSGPIATDLTPSGGVLGVLGTSADGSYLYYLTSAGVFLRHGATTVMIAAAADPGNYPPATGTARVSADGIHLAFVSAAASSAYDNNGKDEVYLYSAASGVLTCVSCNPSGERPLGSSSIPGALANGEALRTYKPRVLSASGTRLFFESSDELVSQDTNNAPDVYQWEAAGTGDCTKPIGCVNLVSSGRDGRGASFVDASADGSDAFFLTEGSLIPSDPSAADVYDARVGGGFPLPRPSIPCVGDACQAVPGEPEDPTPGTIASRAQGNPALKFSGRGKAKKHRDKHHKSKRGSHKNRHRKRGGGR